MNWIGPAAAMAAFLGIWLGHVTVRRVEAAAPKLWIPVASALALGFGLEYGSLLTESRMLSSALGILGITVLWDALELFRQQNRVRRGHAPANPGNSRHVRILAQYPAATVVDLLNREPVFQPQEHEGTYR
jgi:uncharacterized protein DUF4491